jgi:hypothetical protein
MFRRGIKEKDSVFIKNKTKWSEKGHKCRSQHKNSINTHTLTRILFFPFRDEERMKESFRIHYSVDDIWDFLRLYVYE